jgi:hypothetical protein
MDFNQYETQQKNRISLNGTRRYADAGGLW